MCLCSKLSEMNKTKSPRSPWRRQNRELLKPKLSRKIVPSARVNLNNFWDAFEDLSKQKSAMVTFDSPNIADVLRSSAFSSFHDNEINENLVNELLELGRL